MRAALLVLLAPVLLGAAALPAGAEPRLLADLLAGEVPEAPYVGNFDPSAADGGILYFTALDPAHGRELWRTDGTAAGTYRLTDVCPGRCDSTLLQLTVFRGQIFFVADDGFSGYELWRSAGTPGSERRVLDLCPGPCGTHVADLRATANGLLFFASDGDGGTTRLWRTNGSRRGTVPIATPCGGVSCDFHFTPVGGNLLFLGTNGAGQGQLWRTDGTPAGTRRLRVPGLPRAESALIPAGDQAFFWTRRALWRTDGTAAGTVRLLMSANLPDEYRFEVRWATVWQGRLYAQLHNGVLVRSDGTPEGTNALSVPLTPPSVYSLTTIPDWILLVSPDGSLWRTRGTGAAEKVVQFGSPDRSGWIGSIWTLGDLAMFRLLPQGAVEPELWVTDGTAEGTRRLEGVPGGTSSLALAGDQGFYLRSRRQDSYHFRELWRTDGTADGTRLIHDFGDLPASSGPVDQAALGGAVLFSARTGELEAPLFRTDGTPGGTRVLSAEADFARGFTPADGRLFFLSLRSDRQGNSLWSTDGTAAGTAQVAAEMQALWPVGVLGRSLLFGGVDRVPYFGGRERPELELWRSDGHTTHRVKDINPHILDLFFQGLCMPEGSAPGPGVVVGAAGGERMVFAADDGRTGRELWVSDGTRDGTRLLADFNPRRLPEPPDAVCDGRRDTGLASDPRELVPLRRGVLFTANDGVHGREIAWTDGTPAGTRLVADLRPGAAGSEPHNLTPLRNAVYFFAAVPGASGGGEGLWRTDGRAAGTTLVLDLGFAGLPSWGRELTQAGDRLFFVVYNESTGPELWTSQGTAGSTRLVADLRPGAPGSYPQGLTAAGNGRVVFAAEGGETGMEPWISDGTAAGTLPLGDINPGRDASSPGPFTPGAGFVLTGAWDPVHGREPWGIALP